MVMLSDEEILQEMRKTKVDGEATLSDFLHYTFLDAKSLGVFTTYDDRWHWYSDIRCDEMEETEIEILKPVLATVKKLILQGVENE